MKRRRLGKTGLETSIIGMGGFHLVEIPMREVSTLLNGYLDTGHFADLITNRGVDVWQHFPQAAARAAVTNRQ